MALTKEDVLRMMKESENELTEYIFIEMGLIGVLDDLVRDGYVRRVQTHGDFDRIQMTEKGREFLSKQQNTGA